MKKLTKKQEAILNAYNNAWATCLRDVYGSWSWAKEHAYNACKKLCDDMNGYDFKIISYNTSMFSIGFMYEKDGATYLHYETNITTLDFKISEQSEKYDFEDFKKDYDALSDENKKHLANSGVSVHSMREAKDLMRTAQLFDVLFNM